ncbi:MAG TPA: hypothetical protein VJV79_31795, partial [Polyangiaceae bacterium]|nr:hypothetical protein [Polyangiaceae bacterium]
MSTSDPRGGVTSIEPAAPGSTGASALDFAAMVGEVSRIANEFFSGLPGSPVPPGGFPSGEVPPASLATPGAGALAPVAVVPPVTGATPVPGPLPPPRVGPSAASVGGGGLSGAASQPPLPGMLHTPPLPASPFPKEA